MMRSLKGFNNEGKKINLATSLRKDKKAVRLTFNLYGEQQPFNKFNTSIIFNLEQAQKLVNNLIEYLHLWKQEVVAERKAYSEEISTYKNGVERSLYLIETSYKYGILKLGLDCYTDKEYDNNWIELTPKKACYLVSLLLGHINSAGANIKV